MKQTSSILLRRTLAVASLALAIGLPAEAQQQKVQLFSGSSLQSECQYDSATTTPDGNIRVTCKVVNASGATFSVTGPLSIAPDTYTVGDVKVSRAGGPATGYYNVINYSVSGTGCSKADNPDRALPFMPGYPGGGVWNIPFKAGASGSCTISISGWTSPDIGSPASLGPITITGGGGGNGSNPAGCPAPQTSAVAGAAIGMEGSVQELRLKTGQVAYFKVPKALNPATSVTVQFLQGEQPASPPAPLTEFVVSKCKGVMDEIKTNTALVAPQCYYASSAVNNNVITIYTDPFTDSQGNIYNKQSDFGWLGCYAPTSVEDQYLNVRWTYNSSNNTCGNNCGFSVKWAPTGSTF